MSWIKLSSVTATSGQKAVVVNSGEPLANVKQRDGLIIGINQFVEIASTSVTAEGKPVLMLQDNWPAATVTNQPAKVVPTAGDFVEAARMLREVSVFASSTFGGLNEFITSTNDTFTVVDALGNTQTIPTYHFYREKLTADTQTSIDKASEATAAAQTATQKAIETSNNAATVANLKNEVVQKHGEVLSKASTVTSQTATVNQKAAEVATNASTVASNTTTTTQKAAEATAAANTSTNNARLSKEWAVGLTPPAGNTAPSNTNNAMYWAQQAQHNANQTFISGGLFTPTTQTPYPNTTGVVRDTIWLVEFAAASTTFTYTSGQLSGKTVKNGDMIFWDTPENKFNLIPTKLGGILSLITEWGTEEGPSVDIRGRYLRKSGDAATGLITAPGFKLAGGYQGVTGSNSKNVIRTTQANDGVVVGDSASELYLDYLTEIKVRRGSAQTPGKVYTSIDKPTPSELGAVADDWAEANLTKKYELNLGSDGSASLPRYGKLVSIGKTDSSASLLITGGGDFGVASRFSALVVISSRGNQVGVQAVEFTSSTDPMGFKLFSRDTGTRFELWVSGGDYNLTIQITQLNSQGTATPVDWTPATVGTTVPDNLVAITPAKIYTQYNKPSPSDIGAVAGSTKAGFLPAGPTTSRPTTSEFPTNTRALRFNTTTGEWEGLDPSGNITPIGGGGVPPFIEKTAPFTVEKKKAYKLKMVDGVNKVVTVPDGFANDDWFVISTLEWNRGLTGLTATVQFGTEVLSNGQDEFDGYIIDRPCVLYFLRSGGKWTLADGIGADGSYNALETRVDKLEEPNKYLFVGNELTSNTLSESIRNFEFISITAVASTSGIQHEFNTLIPTDSIASIGRYLVMGYTGNSTSGEVLFLFLTFPSDTTFTLIGNNGSIWTKPAIARIKGVNRL